MQEPIEIRCPSCKKRNVDNRVCSRCGCDISTLLLLAENSYHAALNAAVSLNSRDYAKALDVATLSWKMKKTSAAARIAFIASMAGRRYSEAILWHRRTVECTNPDCPD
jgi:ribosomal protein L32